MKLSKNMSEIIGAIIGDGNIYDKSVSYVEITGNIKEDKIYFENYLKLLIEEELNYTPRIFLHGGALRLRINNTKFVSWVKELGIPDGQNKFKNVLLPKKILNNSWRVQKSCIRGIFDTDGGVYFDKRKIYSRPYIRIELHVFNNNLLSQIYDILKSKKLPVVQSLKREALYFNGFENVKKFLENIGFSNPRHIEKIKTFYPQLIEYNCALIAQLVERSKRKTVVEPRKR